VPSVSWLSIAPVKGLALIQPDEVVLTRRGVAANRRFFMIDENARHFGLKQRGRLVQIRPDYNEETERLVLHLPDGSAVGGQVQLGEPLVARFSSRAVSGRLVEGPWSDAISAQAGRPIRLVKTDRPGDGVDRAAGQISLVSDESVAEIGRQAGRNGVDARRFRMLIGVRGCEPHGEDAWVGKRIRVGAAVAVLRGHVGRCAITTQNPDTGDPDFDTLRTIKAYRGLREGRLDFGVYGEVLEPGLVRVGDPVEPLEQRPA
jgi:uncharacterized protein YcbX